MKKIFISLSFLLFSVFSFGQSVTLTPNSNEVVITNYSNTPEFIGRRASGLGGSPFPTLSDVDLAHFGGAGYNGSAFTNSAATINIRTAQAWTPTANGTKIIFSTVANGSTTLNQRMTINHDGNVGIGNSAPTAKLHINHLAGPTSPTIHLQSTGSSSSFIRATSTAAGSEWENHFMNSTSAGANLVYWQNSVNSKTPLILTGEGDAIVDRALTVGNGGTGNLISTNFTKLGGSSAPAIKMKSFTNTTSNAEGGDVFFAHGLDATKIISYTVLVDVSGLWVKEGHLQFAGRQFDSEVNNVNIRVYNHATNSENILSKTIKVLITYTE
jgi:hypothetical protein